MYNHVTLPQDVEDVMEPVTGKPGLVRLPFKQLYSRYFKPATPVNLHQPNYYLPYVKAEYIYPQ